MCLIVCIPAIPPIPPPNKTNVNNVDSFIKINGDQIRVVIKNDKHDSALANSIMRTIQSCYENGMYISIKFE